MSIEEVVKEYGTDALSGLNGARIPDGQEKYGKNLITETKQKGPVWKFIKQFNDPLIYILLAAGLISAFMKEFTDCGIIIAVVLINAVTGYIQEDRAEKSIEALKKLTSPKALVIRDGKNLEIHAEELVPGDVVLLDAGRVVPADLRLIETQGLKIEESALTGESEPAEKDSGYMARLSDSLGDLANMAFMSTGVSLGRAKGIVTATGMNTEIGKIAKNIQESGEELTPLQKRLAGLGKTLGISVLVLCAVLFAVSVFQHRNIGDMLITAISLAVAAIPEGLPAVVTIVLAMGVQRMAKNRAIVRRLQSVETLGACSVICSDKTGTLTQNKMTVVKCFTDGKVKQADELEIGKDRLLLEGFALCCDADIEREEKIGDPTETALLEMAKRYGIIKRKLHGDNPRTDELPFDSSRKMMTTLNDYRGRKISFTKGALDMILKHTTAIYADGATREIKPLDIDNINTAASEMASRALRVLALGIRESGGEISEEGLTFVGFCGMMDPPRQEAGKAVADCRNAGIKTAMITGDHRDTALAIAMGLGIANGPDEVVSGDELSGMEDNALENRVMKLSVFARVSPEHKVRIVRAYRKNGCIVAMTGDGVNDAPSLKAADIGIAMGASGTEVAKGAADMIITDDNFATIVKAVEQGRGIYENIKKAVIYLIASNLGEILSMLIMVLAGLPSPLTAVQILWVNLVTDSLPALALGIEKTPPKVMLQKPRGGKESLFSHGGGFATLINGALIGGATIAGFFIGSRAGGLMTGRTYAVSVLALSQVVFAICMRSPKKSLFMINHLENRLMAAAVLLGAVLQIVIVQTPAGRIFGTVPLAPIDWLAVVLLALVPALYHEIALLFVSR